MRTPYVISLIVGVFAVTLCLCSGGLVVGYRTYAQQRKPDAPPVPIVEQQPQPADPVPDPRVVGFKPGEIAATGPVRIELSAATIGIAPMYDKIRKITGKSEKLNLTFKIKITNASDTTLVYYRPWMTIGSQPTLRDELGNTYALFRSPFGVVFKDQLQEQTRLDPGAAITDTLYFDRPIDAATEFSLTLPTQNVGQGDPPILFKVPRAFVTVQP